MRFFAASFRGHRRPTGDRPLQLVESDLRAQRGKHEFVRSGPFRRDAIRHRFPGDLIRTPLGSRRKRPPQSLTARLVRLGLDRHFDARLELLPHPGHSTPDRRTRIGQRRGDLPGISDDNDLGSERLLQVERGEPVRDVS